MPNKSGNLESLKKQLQEFKSFSTIVLIVGEDLLRAFYRLFYSLKKHCVAKVLLAIWEIFLYENNRNYNSYIFSYKFAFTLFFFISYKPKTRIRFSASWWSGNEKYFCFLFIASRALLQSYAEFNRPLQRNFLTCYSLFIFLVYFILISSFML